MNKKVPPVPEGTSESTNMMQVNLVDRMAETAWTLWQRWQKAVIGLIAVVSIGVFIWQGQQLLSAKRQDQIVAAFQTIGDDEAAALAFTTTYPETPQAGLAFLKLAHRRYTNQAYTEAADFYRRAMQCLPDNPWQSRARLGEAMAIAFTDPLQGKLKLQSLTEIPTVLDSIRAQAAYHLAVLYWEAGRFPAIEEQINFINNLEYAGVIWRERAQALLQKIPPLPSQRLPDNPD